MDPIRIASFSYRGSGGNPAGVVIADVLPARSDMQRIAADLGYSETAFAAPDRNGWRVRFFAPVGEVAFCGHATIALGAALGLRQGAGQYALNLRDASISVEAFERNGQWSAALQSPETWSKPLPTAICDSLLTQFDIAHADLNPALPPLLAFAGVRHAVLCLRDRNKLAQMSYPYGPVRHLMLAHDLVTVSLLHITSPRSFAARNAFASGGVIEDPATGAAAAALGGALVDLDWDGLRAGGAFDILQGADMGSPSALRVEVTGVPGASVRVSGAVRRL